MTNYIIRVYAKGEEKKNALYVSDLPTTINNYYTTLSVHYKEAVKITDENIEKVLKIVKADFGKNYKIYKELA